MQPPDWLTVARIAAHLAVTPAVVRGWIDSGELHAVETSAKPGSRRRRWLVDPAAFAAFLAARSNRAAALGRRKRVPAIGACFPDKRPAGV